jgi:lysophospholipase L1-like esterase
MRKKLILMVAIMAISTHAKILIQTGAKVAFLGDSITAQGWTSPHGYVRLVVAGLEANGIKIEPIPAGVGGHKSNDMLARVTRDVIDKKPDWVTISCGMNDVIHGAKGVPLDQYKINMTVIVDQCQAAGIKVILFTTTAYGSWNSPQTQQLGEYSAFLRELAKRKNCMLVDLYNVFVEAVKTTAPLRALTGDGCHMSPEGNILLSKTILMGLGCTNVEIAKAYETWMDIPDTGNFSARVDVVLNKKFFSTNYKLTLRQREKVIEAAKAAKKPTLMHWSKDLLLSLMKKKLKPSGPYESLDALFAQDVKDKVQAELQTEFEAEIRRIITAGH